MKKLREINFISKFKKLLKRNKKEPLCISTQGLKPHFI
jgi:hypothetical protein